MCSVKWARPFIFSGSYQLPTLTSIAAYELSLLISETKRTFNLFYNKNCLYYF